MACQISFSPYFQNVLILIVLQSIHTILYTRISPSATFCLKLGLKSMQYKPSSFWSFVCYSDLEDWVDLFSGEWGH